MDPREFQLRLKRLVVADSNLRAVSAPTDQHVTDYLDAHTDLQTAIEGEKAVRQPDEEPEGQEGDEGDGSD